MPKLTKGKKVFQQLLYYEFGGFKPENNKNIKNGEETMKEQARLIGGKLILESKTT